MAPHFQSDDPIVEALFLGTSRRRGAGRCIARRLYRRLASRRGSGARPRCRVVLAADEDDGHLAAGALQLALEEQPAHPGQPHVEEQAADFARTGLLEELFRRLERFGGHSHRA